MHFARMPPVGDELTPSWEWICSMTLAAHCLRSMTNMSVSGLSGQLATTHSEVMAAAMSFRYSTATRSL